MKKNHSMLALLFFLLIQPFLTFVWSGTMLPQLHVEGRNLKDSNGYTVILHGFAQTYSPYFNELGKYWTNYDVNGCLSYNKGVIDRMLAAGWKVNFMRLHMDPYWSNTPGCQGRYEGEECFDETRFTKYLDEVFIPMAEYCVSKGLYVVMRPPGVFPEKISVGDIYNQYLIKVWKIVSNHPKLKNHPNIMFELGNEPINILGTDGTYGSSGDAKFTNLQKYMQSIIDVIRNNGSNNILWIPGLGYQSSYSGFVKYPLQGENLGFAIHLYPGWFGSSNGYLSFQREWDSSIKPVADIAPIMVTEMDWAPEAYNSSWGKSTTGVVGGAGFGANFKYIADNSGNESWLVFTDAAKLAEFKDETPASGTAYSFLNDPEACPWQTYHWFKEYANQSTSQVTNLEILGSDLQSISSNQIKQISIGSDMYILVKATYADGHIDFVSSKASYQSSNTSVAIYSPGRITTLKDGFATITIGYGGLQKEVSINASYFLLLSDAMNLTMYGNNTFDNSTHTLHLTQWGQAGWTFGNGINLSGYKYLVFKFGTDNYPWGTHIKVIDGSTESKEYKWEGHRELIIDLQSITTDNSTVISPKHITAVRFWSAGGDLVLDKVYLTNKADASEEITGLADTFRDNITENDIVDVYSVTGKLMKKQLRRGDAKLGLPNGVYIIGRQKVVITNNQ